MVEVVRRERKSPVLTPSSIPCLQALPTINLTQGCALGCTYCYIQSYADYPGPDRVILYENTPELIRQELARKRRRPRRVYFSPSSDAFQFLPEVQEIAAETIGVLLAAGVEVSFLTKGFITRKILDVISSSPDLVFAQIGMTTLDTGIWRTIEPRTAPPQKRIEYIDRLRHLGVDVSVRLDPLIPDHTDTRSNLAELFTVLQSSEVRRAAASYLFLRAKCTETLIGADSGLVLADDVKKRWPYQRFDQSARGGRMLEELDRASRFERIRSLGNEFGIDVVPCRCKNPSLSDAVCGIAGPFTNAVDVNRTQMTLGLD